jgi:nitrite reductase (NAD(P)H)
MPLLDGPRNGETVTASAHNGIPIIDGVDPTTLRGDFDQDPNRRQKIVVVGLGMVAVAFMYVASAGCNIYV